MTNPSLSGRGKSLKEWASPALCSSERKMPDGRGARPMAIVDIGSNSVRLVAYEGLTRAPTPIFNEKAMCGLGKGVATSGRWRKRAWPGR